MPKVLDAEGRLIEGAMNTSPIFLWPLIGRTVKPPTRSGATKLVANHLEAAEAISSCRNTGVRKAPVQRTTRLGGYWRSSPALAAARPRSMRRP